MTANPPCAWPRFGKTSRVCETFKPSDAKRFEAALRRFDAENARDPNREMANDISHPRELLYAQRLTDWVLRLCPDASEELRLAARCQHICRWEIPRSSYPMTRPGYLKWRADLKKFHAQKAGQILFAAGYDESVIRRVQDLNLKNNFPNDPEGRVQQERSEEHRSEDGLGRTGDGDLIRVAEAAGFDLLIICDKNLQHQQNLAARKLAILEL